MLNVQWTKWIFIPFVGLMDFSIKISRYESNRPTGLKSLSYMEMQPHSISYVRFIDFHFVSFHSSQSKRFTELWFDKIVFLSCSTHSTIPPRYVECQWLLVYCTTNSQSTQQKKKQLNISTDRNDKLRFFWFRGVVLMELILGDFWHAEDGTDDGKN